MASVTEDEPIRDVVDRMVREALQNAENLRRTPSTVSSGRRSSG